MSFADELFKALLIFAIFVLIVCAVISAAVVTGMYFLLPYFGVFYPSWVFFVSGIILTLILAVVAYMRL
jgi:uncharacterized membrane protein (DUF106 family)